MERQPESLRSAYSAGSPIGTPVHPECVKTVEETASLLESLGHRVEEAQPEIDGHAVARSFLLLYFSVSAGGIEWLETMLGRKPKPSDVEPLHGAWSCLVKLTARVNLLLPGGNRVSLPRQ